MKPIHPHPTSQPRRHSLPLALSTIALALLSACGGGGGDGGGTQPPLTCSATDQKTWLRDYFNDWYFWYALSPQPSPGGSATVDAYFNSLLYTGGDPNFPTDRWSGYESTESFNQFYGDGKTLGYGLSVAGLEVTGMPNEPLYVRYVEPLSPAATAGIVRGDEVLTINGRSAADIIAADDFSALTPDAAGQALNLRLRNTGGERNVTVTSAVFSLSPVQRASVVTTPLGRRMGYLVVKDMISQARNPIANAFADFRAQGVSDVVIDLRYNGGGLVSVASELAGYVGGSAKAGQVFASLLYNDKRAASNNSTFRFASPAPTSALGINRAYVLTGQRTCSASELVINGLRGVGITVVAIGDTTCGKPVGFLPESDGCGTTYSIVNFESVNARNEGRYFDGFDATCPVAEDWTKALGANDEPLLAAARSHADNGSCPVGGTRERPLAQRRSGAKPEAGERQGMIPR